MTALIKLIIAPSANARTHHLSQYFSTEAVECARSEIEQWAFAEGEKKERKVK